MDYCDLVHSEKRPNNSARGGVSSDHNNNKTTTEESRPGSRKQNSLVRLYKKELKDDFDDLSAYLSGSSNAGKSKLVTARQSLAPK